MNTVIAKGRVGAQLSFFRLTSFVLLSGDCHKPLFYQTISWSCPQMTFFYTFLQLPSHPCFFSNITYASGMYFKEVKVLIFIFTCNLLQSFVLTYSHSLNKASSEANSQRKFFEAEDKFHESDYIKALSKMSLLRFSTSPIIYSQSHISIESKPLESSE